MTIEKFERWLQYFLMTSIGLAAVVGVITLAAAFLDAMRPVSPWVAFVGILMGFSTILSSILYAIFD